jgi:hypothetical protein
MRSTLVREMFDSRDEGGGISYVIGKSVVRYLEDS